MPPDRFYLKPSLGGEASQHVKGQAPECDPCEWATVEQQIVQPSSSLPMTNRSPSSQPTVTSGEVLGQDHPTKLLLGSCPLEIMKV